METKSEIISGASELFKRYGIKSITMDDLAHKLGISKKTIYQHFDDKDSLVQEFVKSEMEEQQCKMADIATSSTDVMEELIKTSDLIRIKVSQMNPSMLYDLRKYHPASWKFFQQSKACSIIDSIRNCLKRGINEGFFRKDIDLDILSIMRVETIEMAFNPDVFSREKFDIREIHQQLFIHFVYGISTLKGHQRIDELMSEFTKSATN